MKPCRSCGAPANNEHHIFPQDKANRLVYRKLIDLPWNKAPYCRDCHTGHAKIRPDDIKDEAWFRGMLYATGHNDLPEPTKSLKNKMMRRK